MEACGPSDVCLWYRQGSETQQEVVNKPQPPQPGQRTMNSWVFDCEIATIDMWHQADFGFCVSNAEARCQLVPPCGEVEPYKGVLNEGRWETPGKSHWGRRLG